jgi:hypothetical protein
VILPTYLRQTVLQLPALLTRATLLTTAQLSWGLSHSHTFDISKTRCRQLGTVQGIWWALVSKGTACSSSLHAPSQVNTIESHDCLTGLANYFQTTLVVSGRCSQL